MKSCKPSKELLSEVLGFVVTSIYVAPNDKFIEAQSEYQDERINIYELMHMMKEWAKAKYESTDFNVYGSWQCDITIFGEQDIVLNFHADTEFEAVTKACEWILKEDTK
jgi:hypothetical protein